MIDQKRNVGKFMVVICLLLVLAGCQSQRPLTFIAWSDTHFGAFDASDPTRLRIIDQINHIAQRDLPAELGPGQKVGPPAFLICLGDITENGRAGQWDNASGPDQQSYLETLKHLNPAVRAFEVVGNHDSRKGNRVREKIAAREGGTYYSFDVQGVHFVALDPYPHFNTTAPELDEAQLEWLQHDLGRLTKRTPIVLAMHVSPDSGAGDRTSHLSPENARRLAQILRGKNVLAILHGHWHKGSMATWQGFPILATGFSYRAEGCPRGDPTFLVVRIVDGRIMAAEFNWRSSRWGTAYLNGQETPP